MGSASLTAFQLDYSEIDGETSTQEYSGAIAYNERIEIDMVLAAGTHVISMGSIAAANGVMILPIDQSVEVQLDSEVSGHVIGSGGIMFLFDSAITAVTIVTTVTTKIKVLIFGD